MTKRTILFAVAATLLAAVFAISAGASQRDQDVRSVAAAVVRFPAAPAHGVHVVTNGRIAFVAETGGRAQLFTISPDGTGLTQVTHEGTAYVEYGTTWSPDGSSLLFVVSGNRDVIYKSAPDGTGAAPLSPACTGQCLGDGFPTYARSGARIALERAYGPIRNNNAAVAGIFTMNADGTGLRQLTQKKRPTSSEDHKPNWSPDGKRIAFQRINESAEPTGVGAVYVMNAGGGHVRRLTPYSMNASDPKWSRNGTAILFNSYDEPVAGKDANVFTMRTDESGRRQLTHYTGGNLQAYVDDWSPDGRQILFHLVGTQPNRSQVNQLFVMNANGTGVHQLTHMSESANPRNAAWGTAG
jgi:Tol biopolymer transport system component